jgi:hypothetical protein
VRSSLPSAGRPIHKEKLHKKGGNLEPEPTNIVAATLRLGSGRASGRPGTPDKAVAPREGLRTRRGRGRRSALHSLEDPPPGARCRFSLAPENAEKASGPGPALALPRQQRQEVPSLVRVVERGRDEARKLAAFAGWQAEPAKTRENDDESVSLLS